VGLEKNLIFAAPKVDRIPAFGRKRWARQKDKTSMACYCAIVMPKLQTDFSDS
jgi:hypothetical protein